MNPGKQVLSLTPAHVALVHRMIEDAGPPAGQGLQSDADYAAWVSRVLATHPAPREPTLLFAYGSLIWRPEIEHVDATPGILQGWHRSFCLRQLRFRGTPDCPGLMMALDEGGMCEGVLFELPEADLDRQFDRLFRREFTVKPNTNVPCWLNVQTDAGQVVALAFVMNRRSPLYAGDMSLEDTAAILAKSCGHLGTGAEYLLNTITHLELRGIHDPYLWQLQELVAERIGPA